MDISFYTAKTGAKAQQNRLDVLGNNMANVNTIGFKADRAGFVDLMHSNIREAETVDTQLKVGCGARVEKTDIDFSMGGLNDTGNPEDHAIIGKGFFAVKNPLNEEIYYTRDGSFKKSLHQDGNFYLVTANGDLVLDENQEKIEVKMPNDKEKKDKFEPNEGKKDDIQKKPAVYNFVNTDGMIKRGKNLFSPVPKNGEPILDEEASVKQGYLESSNVEVSEQMVKLIETQKVYNMTLRMITTSDEMESTINSLRG